MWSWNDNLARSELQPMKPSLSGHVEYSDEMDENLLRQLVSNEKMAELGMLSIGMVHEINSPLSVIASAAQMILREGELSEFVQEMVERIGEESRRLSQLTRGLLSFAREEEGTAEESDINRIVRDAMAFLKYEARKRSIDVVEDLNHRMPAIKVDPNKLKQVLINLVMNAVQAMPEGGALRVATRLVQGSRFKVQGSEKTIEHRTLNLERDGDFVEISVTDTGPGIPGETLPHIFEPFYTTKEPGQGTGLGLFITKSIVRALKGTIHVESEAGKGSSFTVLLPAE